MTEEEMVEMAKKLLSFYFSEAHSFSDLDSYERNVIDNEKKYRTFLDWIGLGPQVAS